MAQREGSMAGIYMGIFWVLLAQLTSVFLWELVGVAGREVYYQALSFNLMYMLYTSPPMQSSTKILVQAMFHALSFLAIVP